MADDPRGHGTVYINARMAIAVVLTDVPGDLDSVEVPDDLEPDS